MEKSTFEYTEEFFDMWLKSYNATFGKTVPAIGPMREKSEKTMRGFSLFVNFYASWMDTNVNLQHVFLEAMNNTYNKISKKDSLENYDDFYKVWIDTYSETFKEFFKSGHFASDMGRSMSHFIDFQTFLKEMLEENYLKPMNLPTKSEIEEINKELYSIKKKLKELTEELNIRRSEQKENL